MLSAQITTEQIHFGTAHGFTWAICNVSTISGRCFHFCFAYLYSI